MAEVVYILSTLTCGICAFLLFRHFIRSKVRLLMWIALCFAGLTINNFLLIVDLMMTSPETDLSMLRMGVADLSIGILALGLVWESR